MFLCVVYVVFLGYLLCMLFVVCMCHHCVATVPLFEFENPHERKPAAFVYKNVADLFLLFIHVCCLL